MKLVDAKPGLRVRRSGGDSSLVRDNNTNGLRGRRTGVIIALPAPGQRPQVVIRWEGSNQCEAVAVHRLELVATTSPVAADAATVPIVAELISSDDGRRRYQMAFCFTELRTPHATRIKRRYKERRKRQRTALQLELL